MEVSRRQFIKTLAVLAPAISIAPTLILPDTKIEPAKWFEGNGHWLLDWIHNAEPAEIHNGMQIFQTKKHITATMQLRAKIEIVNFLKNDTRGAHVFYILKACVFGVGSEMTILNTGVAIRHMAGFIEQTGRYPTKRDRPTIRYLEGRWLNELEHLTGYGNIEQTILSECRVDV